MTRVDCRNHILAFATASSLMGLIFAATPASAQSNEGEMACQNDAFRLCEQFIPDRGKVAACLRKNRLRLSPDCRRMFSGGKKKSLRRR
jgi:hypothetical protein